MFKTQLNNNVLIINNDQDNGMNCMAAGTTIKHSEKRRACMDRTILISRKGN